MRLGATEGSFKTLPESLKEIRVGVLGACGGSLGPDWSNFLCQRGKGEHRNTEKEMNKGGNDQRVRASKQAEEGGGEMSDQTENGLRDGKKQSGKRN